MDWARAAEPLIAAFSIAFTQPTFQRVVVLTYGAILSLRCQTVTALLRVVAPLARGHWSDFHRVLCCRVWSTWPLGHVLAALVLELLPPDQPVVCPVDDTNPQHKGQRVYGKGRHHDALRSTHSHMVWVWGHKGVVSALNVKFPFASVPGSCRCSARCIAPRNSTRRKSAATWASPPPRNWSKPSVLRTAPCLLGLFSLVSLIFARRWRHSDPFPGQKLRGPCGLADLHAARLHPTRGGLSVVVGSCRDSFF